MRRGRCLVLVGVLLTAIAVGSAWAAYHHGGDTDSELVVNVYPDLQTTKLDSCALCHTGGRYEKKPGKWVSLGSCQWCHYSYGYDSSGDIDATLNPYGRDFRDHGRDEDALKVIESLDSDQDGFSNAEEITAVRFPGDADDDPTKVPAPYRVYTREALSAMPQHTQFMLMNTHKSGDFYAEYSGVTMAGLLDDAGILTAAESITVFAPDGWSQYHPLQPDSDPLFYHVYGAYPAAGFYYDVTADAALSETGWCDYNASSCAGRTHGDPIDVAGGLQLLLASARDGAFLSDGVLTVDNKLDGEGPFRVVPPQKRPGPPDQSSYLPEPEYLWPFDENADHNAGYATRSATIIKVDPLPEGITDIDTMEAGWDYVDQKKIVVYGAIDPLPTIKEKAESLLTNLQALPVDVFKSARHQRAMLLKAGQVARLFNRNLACPAVKMMEKQLLRRMDGCLNDGTPDHNDWITDCQIQKQVYWKCNEIKVLSGMLE